MNTFNLSDEEVQHDDPAWQFHSIGENKNFGIRTSGLEEKVTACDMIVCYARELKGNTISKRNGDSIMLQSNKLILPYLFLSTFSFPHHRATNFQRFSHYRWIIQLLRNIIYSRPISKSNERGGANALF